MKKIISFIILSLAFSFVQLAWATHNNPQTSPIGVWKTIDDVTGKPKALVQIWESPNKTLHGRVLKVFTQAGQVQHEFCTACEGDRHNKRIVGMTILENLKPNKDNAKEWGEGKILDPKNGKTYNCFVRLTENGQKLDARGYIGLPLFGRTQTWLRVKNSHTA